MKIKVIFVIVFIAGLIAGGFGAGEYVSYSKNREFARAEKVWKYVYETQSAAYDSLARKATYLIQQTLTIKKNKKGQVIYVPSSTMEIQRIIENYKTPIDTLTIPVVGNKN